MRNRFLHVISTVPPRRILRNLIVFLRPCLCFAEHEFCVFFFAGSKLTAAFPCQNFLGSWYKKMGAGKLFLFLFLTRCKKKEN